MCSASAIYLPQINRRFVALFAYGITDESFAVNMARFRGSGWDCWQTLAVNHISNLVWILATVTGSLVGQLVQ